MEISYMYVLFVLSSAKIIFYVCYYFALCFIAKYTNPKKIPKM